MKSKALPRIKICGLRLAEDARVAVISGADAVGVVRAPASPRAATLEQAAAVFAAVPAHVCKVLVAVDAEPSALAEVAHACGADAVQLCGDEDPRDWAALRLPILRRLPVEVEAGRAIIDAWKALAWGFVLEAPEVAGGGGREVDFALAARFAAEVPCLLAGGLHAGNVEQAMQEVQPAGVDASSLLEQAPGVKDHAAVEAFVAAATIAGRLGAAIPATAPAHDPYFGDFGGRFAPETLMASLLELEQAWQEAQADANFREELEHLRRDYAGRPTPLTPARRLSAALGLELWLKREDLLHTGAHKLNNALGQALLAKRMGKTRILAETGAGQHGVATATVCALLGLECIVYMGEVDAARQHPNVQRMELLGARVAVVSHGQKTLKDAINEAMRAWVSDPEAHYLLGSALGPHPFPSMVAQFQEVIGHEARAQFAAQAGGVPDQVVACVGGGSNAIGIFRGFLDAPTVKLVGVEAGGEGIASGKHAARFQGGVPGVLHGCRTWLLQDEHGQIRPTFSVSAGLDYPAVGPEHAALEASGRARYESATDEEALAAFGQLSRLEGIIPALESSHALAWVVREQEALRGQRVVVNLSGRGDKDLDSVFALRAAGAGSATAETAGGRQ